MLNCHSPFRIPTRLRKARYCIKVFFRLAIICQYQQAIGNADIISRGLDLIEKDELSILKKDITEIERMLKALIKLVENKPLNP